MLASCTRHQYPNLPRPSTLGLSPSSGQPSITFLRACTRQQNHATQSPILQTSRRQIPGSRHGSEEDVSAEERSPLYQEKRFQGGTGTSSKVMRRDTDIISILHRNSSSLQNERNPGRENRSNVSLSASPCLDQLHPLL